MFIQSMFYHSIVYTRFALLVVACGCMSGQFALADEPDEKPVEPAAEKPGFPPADELPDLVRLAKDQDVWYDAKRKLVVVDGQVCMRKGPPLEMFACPKGTKEHESIVSVNVKPMVIHAGLLRVGAIAGKPVQFEPKYAPASGTVVDVWVLWKDKGMNKKVKAQEWIRQLKTGKAMEHEWVFAGSGFWTDEETMQRYYKADAGDLICVSNFPTAMLDIPVASSADNADLQFEAFTERIPEKGTKVRLVLIPRLEKKEEPKK